MPSQNETAPDRVSDVECPKLMPHNELVAIEVSWDEEVGSELGNPEIAVQSEIEASCLWMSVFWLSFL